MLFSVTFHGAVMCFHQLPCIRSSSQSCSYKTNCISEIKEQRWGKNKAQGNKTTSLHYPVNRPDLENDKLHPEWTLSFIIRLSHRCVATTILLAASNN